MCGETRDRSRAAAERKNMKTVYQITRKLCRDIGQNLDLTVRAIDRSFITEENAKLERWREHFQQLLNRCDLPTFADIGEAEQDLGIKRGPITIQEVKETEER